MNHQLYRIDATHPTHPDVLRAGLRRHLAVAPLLSVAVRIGRRQQAYVALEGCMGCAIDRCEPGCRVELLRRTTRGAFGSAGVLYHVPKGLAFRPYSRLALAWPGRGARMLTSELLRPYDDARLTLHWHAAGKGSLRVSALLAASGDGPDPCVVLREHGWQIFAMPGPLMRLAIGRCCAGIPRGLPIAGQWVHDPALLLEEMPSPPIPQPLPPHWGEGEQILPQFLCLGEHREAMASSPSPAAGRGGRGVRTATLRQSTYTHLKAILEGRSTLQRRPAQPADTAAGAVPTVLDEAVSPWPRGPGEGKAAMAPADMEAFINAMLASHEIMLGTERGLSRKRVAALLPERHKEHAGSLLLWLEMAGLLDRPSDDGQPYRRPRELMCTDPATIAEQLKATRLPTAGDSVTAKAKEL
jgi:hypothetical protein